LKVEYNFEKRYRFWREIIETIVLTVLMFVIINLAVQNYDVDGPSMEPTLHNQERIMVDKVSYRFHAPARGDVIVFLAPPHPDLNYVKRIIAVPGDVLTVKKTTVILNGVTLNEQYVDPRMQGNLYADIVNLRIPDNEYFVMGDDRINSSDSRDWGLLPRNNIIGRAALIYWPFGKDNFGFLKDESSVYAEANKHHTAEIPSPTSSVHTNAISENATWRAEPPDLGVIVLNTSPLLACGALAVRKRRRSRAVASTAPPNQH
jgi:signal peptidase I